MSDNKTIIDHVYAAFNKRDIDATLNQFSENVSWPKASEGGRAEGKEEIRAYWTRQWQEFDPEVQPVEIIDTESGARVRVHQLVKSLAGDVLFEGEVWHVYTMMNGLIERMDIEEKGSSAGASPSSAFSKK